MTNVSTPSDLGQEYDHLKFYLGIYNSYFHKKFYKLKWLTHKNLLRDKWLRYFYVVNEKKIWLSQKELKDII